MHTWAMQNATENNVDSCMYCTECKVSDAVKATGRRCDPGTPMMTCAPTQKITGVPKH